LGSAGGQSHVPHSDQIIALGERFRSITLNKSQILSFTAHYVLAAIKTAPKKGEAEVAGITDVFGGKSTSSRS
jgi:hypothetical protein